MDRYTYALNNPLSYVDPDGMEPVFREYKDLTEDERRILARFLNMTAGLADVKFSDGSRAIDYVKGITGGNRERIYANVDGGLKSKMETISATSATDKIRFIGPGGQAVSHKSGGIDYDVTFRETSPTVRCNCHLLLKRTLPRWIWIWTSIAKTAVTQAQERST